MWGVSNNVCYKDSTVVDTNGEDSVNHSNEASCVVGLWLVDRDYFTAGTSQDLSGRI